MGHIRQRAGRSGWFGTLRAADGHRREVKLRGCRTKAEARTALLRLEHKAWEQREALGAAVPADVEIESLKTAWHAHVTTQCRPRTGESYELGLTEVMDWLTRYAIAQGLRPPRLVSEIKLADVEAFAAAKLRTASARTTQMRVGAVRAMLRWGIRRGTIGQDPLIRWECLKGPKRRQRRSLTTFEIVKLLENSPWPFRDVWTVFLGTGLRVGELTQLEWSDVDLETMELYVRAEVSKSKRGRTVPLRADAVAILRHLKLQAPPGQRLVFVNRRGNRWAGDLSRRLKPCLEAAGLPKEIDLHCLRHTFGSHLIRGGADVKTVQALLGHSSAMVTLDIYVHAFHDRTREAVELISLPTELRGRAAHRRPSAMGQ